MHRRGLYADLGGGGGHAEGVHAWLRTLQGCLPVEANALSEQGKRGSLKAKTVLHGKW